MDKLFLTESTMEDSFIYKSFNSSNALIDKMVKYIKTSAPLDVSSIEEQYNQIKKSSLSPLSRKVLEAYDDGRIELLYSRDSKVGISVPFIIRKNENGKIVATIFIASFGVLDSDANLNLPVKQLYCLMESAYIALQLQVNPTTIKKNLSLMKICMSVYVQMFMRIFNKEYALSLSPETFEKASYIIGRFFLERIWEYPTRDLIEGYATAGFKYISAMDLDILQSEYDAAKIMDIDDMLKFIKKISPRMSDLNTRYFIERYVNTYHGSSILSIDYLPYVFFILVNTILSSFLISQTALNEIIKNTKGINKFYVELAKSI